MSAAVCDASAITEYLIATERGLRVAARLASADKLHVPHFCGVEVANALRGLVLGGKSHADDAERRLEDFLDLDAERHPIEPHLPRVWELRHNLTPYDAAYVALAEALDAVLITTDAKTAPKFRPYADVEVIA